MPLRSLIFVATLLLTACGGGGQRPDEPAPGRFSAELLNNGTKLFTYTLEREPPPRTVQRRGEPPPRERRLPDPHKGLQAMLLQNGYCREGYVTLEQYTLARQQLIRGECRDSASAADRARFGSGK
jgi:hypothetical protein